VLTVEELEALQARFSSFIEEARGRSPLYAHLSAEIARDVSVGTVLEAAQGPQRRPNLLFAAVHDLLLRGIEHPLGAYYPSVGGDRRPDRDTLPLFRDFLEAFPDEVAERVRTRTTQTNEPTRCAAVLPAVARLAARIQGAIALVELGASAGLLLHLDRYRYRYGDLEWGPPSAGALITTQFRGPFSADLHVPCITARVGIDLDPLTPDNPDDVGWLRACVWPEHVDRLARLDAALAVAAAHDDVELIAGDMLAALKPTVRRVREDAFVCVLHSTALAYLDQQDRASIARQLNELGRERDLARISLEGPFLEPFTTLERHAPTPPPEEPCVLLGLTTWINGLRTDELLARAHPHGLWLEWLAP
jgi:hypothetical protein